MDNELLKKIYEKYEREIYIYVYSICRNKAQAEDLVQETFLKALLSLPKDDNLRAWLYKVARNLTFNELKKSKRNVPLEEGEGVFTESFPSCGKELSEALEKLSPQKREIILLQYAGGLSQKEIAKILNISPQNVRVIAFRARKELKEKLEGF